MPTIPFNKPFLTGNEIQYIKEAVASGKISGNGSFTKKCQEFFEAHYGFQKCLLTTSCTDALEMAAILLDIKEGDEVIVPAYTFVSTANAFALRGATLVFADSRPDHPNLDVNKINALITPKTKAIVVVHYAGLACDMDSLMTIANKNKLYVVEDAAQAIDSKYKGKPVGSHGHLATFSFHETKNVISGEGGMLAINDPLFSKRAEIIWEKGTNRASFFRGEINKYEWVDIGSSFLPSEITAAFLLAQLQSIQMIQLKRKDIWFRYLDGLTSGVNQGLFKTMVIDDYCSNNYHMFYLLCNTQTDRNALIKFLNEHGIWAIFHYQALHTSPFFEGKYVGHELSNAKMFTDRLIRLPLFFDLSKEDQSHIIERVLAFFTMK